MKFGKEKHDSPRIRHELYCTNGGRAPRGYPYISSHHLGSKVLERHRLSESIEWRERKRQAL